jgi:tetratricopeptide (TPR) repeat protein
MSRDNLVYTLCGLVLGLVIGSFLIGPKLARSRLAGNTTAAGAEAPMSAPAGEPSAEPAATTGAPAGNPAAAMGPIFQKLATLKANVEKNPNDFDSLVQLANMYMDAAKFPQSIEYYDRALKIREEPTVRTDLGICYKQAGQVDKALETFRQVQREDPTQWQALYNETILLAENRRFDEAKASLDKLKKQQPNQPEVQQLEQALAKMR